MSRLARFFSSKCRCTDYSLIGQGQCVYCPTCSCRASERRTGATILLVVTIVFLLFSLTGCGAIPPQPNAPSETAVTHTETVQPDGSSTVAQTFTHKGPENERKTAPVAWGSKGVKIGAGLADAADLNVDAVTGEPLFWIGGITIIAGVAILILSKYPGVNIALPPGAGFWVMGAGAAICVLPFVGEALGKVVPAIVILGGVGALLYYANKAGWFKFMTRPEAQVNMMAQGEPDAAAAMAFLNSGGDKAKAKAVKAAAVKKP